MKEKYTVLAGFLESAINIVSQMGLKVLCMEEGSVKLLMPLNKNINHLGTMYAGSLFTLGEMMGGAIFIASFDLSKYYPLIKEVQIRYLRPAATDITVEKSLSRDQINETVMLLEEKGKADIPMELELIDANGEVVSIVTGTWQVRKK